MNGMTSYKFSTQISLTRIVTNFVIPDQSQKTKNIILFLKDFILCSCVITILGYKVRNNN